MSCTRDILTYGLICRPRTIAGGAFSSSLTVAVIGGCVFCPSPLAPLLAQFLVHLHFHNLLDDVPKHFLHGFYDVDNAGEVLALNIHLHQRSQLIIDIIKHQGARTTRDINGFSNNHSPHIANQKHSKIGNFIWI